MENTSEVKVPHDIRINLLFISPHLSVSAEIGESHSTTQRGFVPRLRYQNMITIVISKSDIVTNVTVSAQGIRTAPDYTAHKQSNNWPGSGPGPSACRSLSRTPLTGAPQGRTATYLRRVSNKETGRDGARGGETPPDGVLDSGLTWWRGHRQLGRK